MNIKWKSGVYGLSPGDKSVFQNVMYTLKFAPDNNELLAVLDKNKEYLTINQTLVLDASATSITNFPVRLIGNSLSFKWVCPDQLELLCAN